ncbi:MAG TPA: polymer-forming cytoskeletal protein [Caulobacteraceae bacterium]|nr:polymer-forming cytoskeletal protein [Caulobacteraceae bacterium]
MTSLIASDMTLEGNVSGGGELQIDGVIKGDVRVERVTVGDGGAVEGGIYAEAVEVRGKVAGSITAKQVRLYGACHVDGDITHEQLAMETGAFFQGRSLRLQRAVAPPAQPAPAPRAPEPAMAAKDPGLAPKPTTTP